MPTYDYECSACNHTFEVFQGINDPVKKKCPECGKNTLNRLFGTGAAIVFKGSGFYQTDYRSEGYKKAAEADKKPQTDKKSQSDTKSQGDSKSHGDSKPETKSETKASDTKSTDSTTPKKKSDS